MPVFGKSLFETVLDVVGQQVEEEEDDAPSPIRGFNGSFIGRDWSAKPETDLDPSVLFDGYPPEPVVQEPVIPDWVDRLSETEVTEDLALGNCRTEHDLRERRRVFALENHPDRVLSHHRDQANRRMMIANQLIDIALARFR